MVESMSLRSKSLLRAIIKQLDGPEGVLVLARIGMFLAGARRLRDAQR